MTSPSLKIDPANSKATPEFWGLYHSLPKEAQKLAREKYELWLGNASHTSLGFRKVKGSDDIWRVSIGDHYRAVCVKVELEYRWFWIGSHEEYNGLLRSL